MSENFDLEYTHPISGEPGPRELNEILSCTNTDTDVSNPFILRSVTSNGSASSKVVSTRLQFPIWKCEVNLIVDTTILSPQEVVNFIAQAGKIGCCDGRNAGHGRFEILTPPSYTMLN